MVQCETDTHASSPCDFIAEAAVARVPFQSYLGERDNAQVDAILNDALATFAIKPADGLGERGGSSEADSIDE